MAEGRHIVITGASRGLGLHMARKALVEGYSVTGLARTPDENAGFPMLACDVTNPTDVARCFAALRKQPLWALINAAGAASMNLHLTTPPETMRHLVACNLLGTMYCSAEAGRIFARRRAGRIITFSSIAVALGLEGEASYVAAKAGVEGFTRAFAREMAAFGVTVNAVAPGPIPTRLIAGVPEEKIAALRARQILPRPLAADDVWNVVSWLLEERSASLSGEVLHVGGV